MNIDKITLLDLSIFHPEEDQSIFHKLNFTRTVGGKDWLYKFFREPFRDAASIYDTQKILRKIGDRLKEWPDQISNGTIMVIDRFYDAQIDPIPAAHSPLGGIRYMLLNGPDFSMVRYSLGHFADFTKGFKSLLELLEDDNNPAPLKNLLDRARLNLKNEKLDELAAHPSGKKFSPDQVVNFGHFMLYRFRQSAMDLIQLFGKLDAWYGMAKAVKTLGLQFPEIIDRNEPSVEASQLFHLLLNEPTAYDLDLNREKNFLFLTGANMAGKSTFIKAVGGAIYLAHLGMGVPAQSMRLTLFEGIVSNINVTDNIVRGESFFFNEVQRIRNTILKINDGNKWLVLIDELFKGTNIKDAMKCSLAVIRGLVKIQQSLFVLSTHLYEIGEDLKDNPNMIFRYFETDINEDQLLFNYQLKEGISNDRIGYLILKREKVLELLDKL